MLTLTLTAPQPKYFRNKDDLVVLCPDCFDGIPRVQGTVDKSVPTVVNAQRHVPLSLGDDIKNELSEIKTQGIITKVTEGEPTAWVNSLVCAGRLRTCLDPEDLNKTVCRVRHLVPTLEESSSKVDRCQLRARRCELHFEQDTESSFFFSHRGTLA